MGVLNPDTWKQQWDNFMNYPYIMAVGMIITAVIVWWFRGFQVKIFEARLKFADERAARANDDIAKQFKDFREEIAAGEGTGISELTARIEKLEATVRSAVTGVLSITEAPDIANFRGTVE
jgi:hypothetical protein